MTHNNHGAHDKAIELLTNEDPNWGTPEQQLVRAVRALAWATLAVADSTSSIHIGHVSAMDSEDLAERIQTHLGTWDKKPRA